MGDLVGHALMNTVHDKGCMARLKRAVFVLCFMALSALANTSIEKDVIEKDVVVVGAGFAGLSAAKRLQEAGLNVAVMEAAPRVGGRSKDHAFSKGSVVEEGIQFIGTREEEPMAHKLLVDQ